VGSGGRYHENRNDADWRGWQSLAASYRPDGRDQAA